MYELRLLIHQQTNPKLPWQRSKQVVASTHRYTLAARACRVNGRGSMHTLLIDLEAAVALKPFFFFFVAPNKCPCELMSEGSRKMTWPDLSKNFNGRWLFESRRWKLLKNGDVQSLRSERVLRHASHLCLFLALMVTIRYYLSKSLANAAQDVYLFDAFEMLRAFLVPSGLAEPQSGSRYQRPIAFVTWLLVSSGFFGEGEGHGLLKVMQCNINERCDQMIVGNFVDYLLSIFWTW